MFKVGDTVRRTKASLPGPRGDSRVMVGGEYKVSYVYAGGHGISLEGIAGQYASCYFELVDTTKTSTALAVQHGGNHYKGMKIQPVEYIMANNIPYMEGNVIKYISRWRDKGGVQDLNKAKHYIEMLIENEEKNGKDSAGSPA